MYKISLNFRYVSMYSNTEVNFFSSIFPPSDFRLQKEGCEGEELRAFRLAIFSEGYTCGGKDVYTYSVTY